MILHAWLAGVFFGLGVAVAALIVLFVACLVKLSHEVFGEYIQMISVGMQELFRTCFAKKKGGGNA